MVGRRRTKPRTMWLSKFSSLSSRSKPVALGSLHESFPDAALIRLRCPDAALDVRGFAVATAHVLVDLLPMSQAISKHSVYIWEAQRVVRLDDRLGRGTTTKRMYHNLKQNARVADAKDSWRILSERNRHGLARGHVGARRACHDETVIAIRHSGRKPRVNRDSSSAIGGRYAISIRSVVRLMTIVQYGLACHIVWMKTTMSLDDALVREAMAIHRGKTKTAVVELGLQELVNADRRRGLGEAFGSQPDLQSVARRRSAGDPR